MKDNRRKLLLIKLRLIQFFVLFQSLKSTTLQKFEIDYFTDNEDLLSKFTP